MTDPLARTRSAVVVLAAIFCVAVVGYRYGGNYSWLESLWMVVVTISTVGFGERSQLSPSMQMFTIVVILFGMTAAAYAFGGFVQMMVEGELARIMGRNRMTRDIDKLKDHVIVCGFGRMGQAVVHDLSRPKRPFPHVVIEMDPLLVDQAEADGVLHIQGDATDEEVLKQAGIERARAVISSLPNDAANVFITLTARDLNPSMLIVSRAEQQSTEKKLRQAGVDRVVMPTLVGAHQMVRIITRPSTADLIELVAESSFLDVELDELTVDSRTKLIGVTVRTTEAGRRHRLLVVAVKKADGTMVFNPDAEYVFHENDVLLVMGRSEDIESFRQAYRV